MLSRVRWWVNLQAAKLPADHLCLVLTPQLPACSTRCCNRQVGGGRLGDGLELIQLLHAAEGSKRQPVHQHVLLISRFILLFEISIQPEPPRAALDWARIREWQRVAASVWLLNPFPRGTTPAASLERPRATSHTPASQASHDQSASLLKLPAV